MREGRASLILSIETNVNNGQSFDENGETIPTGEIILNGEDVKEARGMMQPNSLGQYENVVALTLNESGT